MLNFTVGPVTSSEAVLKIGGQQIPYFRTKEFSDIMFENERLMCDFTNAPAGSRAVFLTGSGTAAMEAVVINSFTPEDKVIIVNGGSFGQRFVQICQIHHIPYTEIIPEFGQDIRDAQLLGLEGKGYTGFLVNLDETSVGVLYDIERISAFCRRNNIFLIVDSISSFLCDPFDMESLGVQMMVTGSQKALACAPGVSVAVLSPEAVERVYSMDAGCMYLDMKPALKDGERGQTPFTPAVGILLQIHVRLKEIEIAGGTVQEVRRAADLAADFREQIIKLPFEIVSDSLSNAVTPLSPINSVSAYEIFLHLKDEYHIWVCPNGGALRDRVFRVGHLGALTKEDNRKLIEALYDMKQRGLLE